MKELTHDDVQTATAGRCSGTLRAWNGADPVDDLERRRHQHIVELQGSRNPFVDRPEFATPIWGTVCFVKTGAKSLL